ncbi:MAG: hypothetical protein AB7V14_08590 [Kiritimatiellia bacterium]
MHALAHFRYTAIIAGVCIAFSASPVLSFDIPWITLEDVSLNPTSFYVSINVTNTWSNFYYALEAYEGEPVGPTGGFARVIVSDWLEGTGSYLILHDTSAPLSKSGRTYNAAITPEIGGEYILGPNEVYAPYPFFTSPDISAIASVPTNAGHVLAITYGEGLYTNTTYVPADAAAGFLRIKGTNNIPTNAVVEHGTAPNAWNTK